MSPQSTPDLAPHLLRWLDDPESVRPSLPDEEWSAFRDAVIKRYGLDPERHGRLTIAQRLGAGAHQGGLSEVWDVFEKAPESYPNLPKLLEKADPAERTPSDDESTWPLRNRRQEEKLRRTLRALEDAPSENILETLERLEEEHGPRRYWVWARLGRSPLTMALPNLLQIAAASKQAMDIVESEEDREAMRVALTAAIESQ